jgi:hypothetical protein
MLDTLERFLTLFPDYLPALRRHAELICARAKALSYRDDWDELTGLGQRAERFATALAEHDGLAADPLARTALEAETAELAHKALDRASSFKLDTPGPIPVRDRDAGCAALDFGLTWGRLGYPTSPSGSRVRSIFGYCAAFRAYAFRDAAVEVGQRSDVNRRDKTNTQVGLLRKATALLEEACTASPDAGDIAEFRAKCHDELAELEGGVW